MPRPIVPRIPVDARLPQHHKPRKLSRLLAANGDIPGYELGPAEMPVKCIGHLVCLWSWVSYAFPDGNLKGVDEEELAGAAGWTGDPEVFVSAMLEVGLLETCPQGGFLVHDWEDYGGKLLDYRSAQVIRQARYRANHTPPQGPGEGDRKPSVPETVPQPVQEVQTLARPVAGTLLGKSEEPVQEEQPSGKTRKPPVPPKEPQGVTRTGGRTTPRTKQTKDLLIKLYPAWYQAGTEGLRYEPVSKKDLSDWFQAFETMIAGGFSLEEFRSSISVYDTQVPDTYPRTINAVSSGKWLSKGREALQPSLFDQRSATEKRGTYEQQRNGAGRGNNPTAPGYPTHTKDGLPINQDDLAILANLGRRPRKQPEGGTDGQPSAAAI